jgi:hypothetical protein
MLMFTKMRDDVDDDNAIDDDEVGDDDVAPDVLCC